MNEIFNFRRFGQMLAVDFRRIVRYYGLSFLILCFAEAIIFFMSFGIMRIFGETVNMDTSLRMTIFVICVIVLVLNMPQKCYGFITDRSKGSAYLSLPASTFEKFLSMLIFTIGLSILFIIVAWAVDNVLCNCFPNYFTDLDSNQIRHTPMKIGYDINELLPLAMGVPVFLLGALWFKRGKAAKTLLCLLAVGLIIYVLGQLFNIGIAESAQGQIANIGANDPINILSILLKVTVLVLIYLRIRKIQH